MTSSQSPRCPDWCASIHHESDFREGDFFHSKPFGTYDDGSLGVISVGISQTKGEFHNPEVLIDTLQMTSAQDLRDLARDCLEAADWMDKNLPTGNDLVSHGN